MFLPKDNMTFDVNLKGNVTHERYHGTFTVRCLLTNGESMQIAANIDKMGGNSLTMPEGYRQFIRAICELDFLVLEAPMFWKLSDSGRSLKDQNVVSEVYTKATDQAITYRKKLNDESEALKKASEEAEKKKETASAT